MHTSNALLANELISEASLTQMLSQQTTFTDGSHYGFGWHVDVIEKTNHKYFYHFGSNDGFKTVVAAVKETGLMVVILSNAGDAYAAKVQAMLTLIIEHYDLG